MPRDRGIRKAGRILAELGREFRDARVSAGLSQAFVARAAGIARSTLSLIERNQAPDLTFLHAGAIAAVLGFDLSVRVYPSGPPIRDLGQLRVMARFRALVGEIYSLADRVVLVLADARHNREAVALAHAELAAAFPCARAALLASLRDGTDPGADGLLLI